jgi:hypothetical protein
LKTIILALSVLALYACDSSVDSTGGDDFEPIDTDVTSIELEIEIEQNLITYNRESEDRATITAMLGYRGSADRFPYDSVQLWDFFIPTNLISPSGEFHGYKQGRTIYKDNSDIDSVIKWPVTLYRNGIGDSIFELEYNFINLKGITGFDTLSTKEFEDLRLPESIRVNDIYFHYGGYIDSTGYLNDSEKLYDNFYFDEENGHIHEDWLKALPHKSLIAVFIREQEYQSLLINNINYIININVNRTYGFMLDREKE